MEFQCAIQCSWLNGARQGSAQSLLVMVMHVGLIYCPILRCLATAQHQDVRRLRHSVTFGACPMGDTVGQHMTACSSNPFLPPGCVC